MLRQAGCIKEVRGAATGSLEAPTGRSYLIKRIYVTGPSAAGYLTGYVDRKTVTYYRVAGLSGGHLEIPKLGYINKNLMAFLANQGVNVTIPIEEGQTFTYNMGAVTGNVVIVYDSYDADDIKATMPNGAAAKKYTFIQYMNASTYPSASGDVELDTSLSPAEFPDFPCGKVVPPKHTVKLIALVGNPVGEGTDADNNILSTYCKLVKDRETLFDEDRNGLPFRCADIDTDGVEYHSECSLIHPCVPVLLDSQDIASGDPLVFDPVLQFRAGEELLIYMTFALTGTQTLASGSIDFAAVLEVTVE